MKSKEIKDNENFEKALKEHGPSIEERCEWAETALEAFTEARGADESEMDIIDLVADLMHYAKSKHYDPQSILDSATMHFEAES